MEIKQDSSTNTNDTIETYGIEFYESLVQKHHLKLGLNPDTDLLANSKCFTFEWGLGIIAILLILTLIFLLILLK